jgi:hypothetical protein
MELFNKALFLSQQKIFAFTHRRVYTLMVNLFQILNQFVLLFRKNVIEKSSMIWRVLPLVKINTRISETPCIGTIVLYYLRSMERFAFFFFGIAHDKAHASWWLLSCCAYSPSW